MLKLDSDDFELFGLPRTFRLDTAALDACWRAVQAQVHPDRFASDGAVAQRLAMQWAVRINEARQRLGHPVRRAAYLCELAGVAIDAETNTAMPIAFLDEQMEWREALDEATATADIERLGERLAERRAAAEHLLAETLDDHHDPQAAAAQVRALMFMERFADDIDRRLARADAASGAESAVVGA